MTFGFTNHKYYITLVFKIHNLRRGGATKSSEDTGSVETCVVIGRWASVSSARNYLRKGQALMAQFLGQQSAAQREMFSALLIEGVRVFYE